MRTFKNIEKVFIGLVTLNIILLGLYINQNNIYNEERLQLKEDITIIKELEINKMIIDRSSKSLNIKGKKMNGEIVVNDMKASEYVSSLEYMLNNNYTIRDISIDKKSNKYNLTLDLKGK